MKTIEHSKIFSVCPHTGQSWFDALNKVLTCTGKRATAADMEAIVASMRKGEGAWHSGTLLTPGRQR